MKQMKLPLLLIFLVFAQTLVFGQENISVADSVNNRFTHLVNSSNSYQEFKVIKKSKIQSLQRDIRSEVSQLEGNIKTLHEKLDKQDTQIEALEKKLTRNETKLEKANASKDQLSILGIKTQKGTYNALVILVISVLFIGLLVFIYKYNSSKRITAEASDNLRKNVEEFELYKKKALETQQSLGRQLIDERKKHNSSNKSYAN